MGLHINIYPSISIYKNNPSQENLDKLIVYQYTKKRILSLQYFIPNVSNMAGDATSFWLSSFIQNKSE